METQTCLVEPGESVGGEREVCISSATQFPTLMQRMVAACVNKPHHLTTVQQRHTGGGYGGKITRAIIPAMASTVACELLGSSISCVMDLHTNMQATPAPTALLTPTPTAL